MVLRLSALEMKQSSFVLAPVVQEVREVDPRFALVGVELEGAAQPIQGVGFVAEAVRRVAYARRCLRRVGVRREGDLEEPPRLVEHGLAEQGAPHLEHQIVIVAKPEGEDPVEAGHSARAVAELEQHLAQARQGVFVVRVEADRLLERATGPKVLLAGEPRVAHPHVELHGMGIEPEACSQGLDRFVVLSFVVELMRAFVVVVGAEERFRHRTGLPGRLCYDKKRRTVTQATCAGYLDRR